MAEALEGRVAVVTGGSRNIGRAIALRLAGLGAAVALTYRADAQGASQTVARIAEEGGRAVAYQATLEDEGVPEALIASV